MKQWYENNKEYCKEQAQLYYFSHYPEIKERNNAAAKAYYWKNRDKILAKRRSLVCSTKVYPRKSAPPSRGARFPSRSARTPFTWISLAEPENLTQKCPTFVPMSQESGVLAKLFNMPIKRQALPG